MTELRDRLQQSLGSLYSFERELEGGGMSRVFVAKERALARTVVLKVLSPELGVELNRERFKREILFAAPLQHPHIVPVLSAGDVDGLPYYTMPFIEGESLRNRLVGKRRLPLDDVVRILRDVADALAYAHGRGIVHRDIKPDNVLLAGGHALVTDFGVAKALDESQPEPSRRTITHPGITVGTPAYMAPEQSVGDPVDQRADLYSFGCVAYEALVGEGPFPHPATHRVVTAHLTEAPVPVSERRSDVPPELAALVMQCLEKSPDKRPRSARVVLEKLEAAATGEIRLLPAKRRARRRWWLAAAGAVVAATAAISWRVVASRRGGTPLDSNVVAVVPFRVTGADPSLHSLREGMIDLLDAKFVGAARVVDPRALLSAWRRAGGTDSTDVDEEGAITLARQFGAGQLLLGSVSGGGEARPIQLTAALRDVRGGTVRQASAEGMQDSLPVLLDRLVAQLLALHTGQDARSIASLGDMSIATLREYIEAQAAARRGRFEDAIPRYRAAIARDSTFALAGMGLALTVGWLDDGDWNEGWRVAWPGRDRLSIADRAILEAWVGKAYPIWPAKSVLRGLAEHAVQVAPQKAEAWYALGDLLYHFGALQGLDDAAGRSLTALNRAIGFDSSYGFAAQHLPDLYIRTGDSSGARRAMEHVLALDSTSRYGTFSLWYAGVALGNTNRRDRARAALERMISTSVSVDVAQTAVAAGVGYADAESLLTRLARRGATPGERADATEWLYQLTGVRGQPKAAARLLAGVSPLPEIAMFAMLFENGDSAIAERARREATTSTSCTTSELAAAYDLLVRHDPSMATKQVGATFENDVTSECELGAMTLDVLLAEQSHGNDARELTARLDSALRAAPASPLLTLMIGNLVAMHAFEQLGDPARALNAARRRPILYGPLLGWGAMLREEGRLAALTGDRDGAIRAHRLYVALRADAEASLQLELREARAELEQLESNRARGN